MSIAEVFNWIANNSYLIGISTLGTILGTIIIFFPPQKRPFYAVKSFNLISNSISVLEDLEVKYRCWGENGEEKVDIQCLTISKIIFWNGGRKTITSQDIANKFPIQVASKENVEILGIGLYEESISNKASNISFEKFGLIINDKAQKSIFDVRSRKIDFDFMESGDAAVIVVIHTGISSEDVYLDGYVVDSAFEGKFKLKDISSYEQNNTQTIVFFKVYSLFILGSIFWILITNYFFLLITMILII